MKNLLDRLTHFMEFLNSWITKTISKNFDSPEETQGSIWAREIREKCNKLTDEETDNLYNQALDIIYKNAPELDPRKFIDEEKMLDSFFETEKKTWRGHELNWCNLCYCASIKLNCCSNGSCSGGGCTICCGPTEGFDSTDFSKTKHYIESYLNEDEKKAYQKASYIKKFILESLAAGFNEINWKYLHDNGKLCEEAYNLFEELKEFKNFAENSFIVRTLGEKSSEQKSKLD